MVQHTDPAPTPTPAGFTLPAAQSADGQALFERINQFPPPAREMIYLGVQKLVDYQDSAYAHSYLDRLASLPVGAVDTQAELVTELARFLALWMAFEDLPRVAQIKISPERFARLREEVRAEEQQQVGVVEFLHPRIEEFCGIMPARLGAYAQQSPLWRRLLGLLAKPRNLRTNSVHGFVMLYLLAKMRRFRRASLVYRHEQAQMEAWLAAIQRAAPDNYPLALELARCGRLVKGYGKTRERGTGNVERILAVVRQHPALSADAVKALREAALSEEKGAQFTALERELLAAA
jgi:indolepyruvate ferredoxin oxidoreductase beta subunit